MLDASLITIDFYFVMLNLIVYFVSFYRNKKNPPKWRIKLLNCLGFTPRSQNFTFGLRPVRSICSLSGISFRP